MQATIISVANQKGGVGKTTSTVNLARALVEAGKRVLVIDSDPQSSLSIVHGLDPRRLRELDATHALFDFNHPMAGKAIRFEVKIIGIM